MCYTEAEIPCERASNALKKVFAAEKFLHIEHIVDQLPKMQLVYLPG